MPGYIYQRGKTWTYVVDTGRDPITGKRRQKSKGGFKDKPSAEKTLRKILVELDEGLYVGPSKETFSTYIEYWFTSHYQKRIKETTVPNQWYVMNKHLILENPFSNKTLDKITPIDIDSFYSLKIDEGYSANYIRKMHLMLSKAFQKAVKWRKIKSNPVLGATPPSIKRSDVTIWDYDDIHTFLNQCKSERHYITFLLAIYTGMRRGEILGLKWSDIDFKKKIINVKRSLSFIPKKGFSFTTLKTKNARRKIHIPDQVAFELLNHKKKQEELKTRLGAIYDNQDLVICTEKGTAQDPRNVLRILKRIIEGSGVPDIRFHDIRHTHASILIAQGIDLVKVSKRLGHANPRITLEFYAHLLPNEDKKLADTFQAALQQAS